MIFKEFFAWMCYIFGAMLIVFFGLELSKELAFNDGIIIGLGGGFSMFFLGIGLLMDSVKEKQLYLKKSLRINIRMRNNALKNIAEIEYRIKSRRIK